MKYEEVIKHFLVNWSW